MQIKFTLKFTGAVWSAILLLPVACTNSNAPGSPVSDGNDADENLSRVSIENHEVVFSLDREDLTIGSAVFSVICFQKAQNRANEQTFTDCDIFRVNGVDQPRLSHPMQPIDLNTFLLTAKDIEFSLDGEAYLCLTVKPWFNEIPNESDWHYYAEGNDRYSMLSYCSVDEIPDWGRDNVRVTQNRVQSLEEFKRRLSAPIEIYTSDRALPPRFGSTEFKGGDLRNDELRQCGHAIPMPAGRIPENPSSEPIRIPVGIYAGWLFDDNTTYQCLEE